VGKGEERGRDGEAGLGILFILCEVVEKICRPFLLHCVQRSRPRRIRYVILKIEMKKGG